MKSQKSLPSLDVRGFALVFVSRGQVWLRIGGREVCKVLPYDDTLASYLLADGYMIFDDTCGVAGRMLDKRSQRQKHDQCQETEGGSSCLIAIFEQERLV